MRAAAFLPALIALAAGAGAQAQTVEVLTGEHGSFTRLAMVLPPAVPWSLEEEDGDHTLRIDRVGLFLDASRAFTRIDRARIAALEPLDDGTGLLIRLNCDCPVVAFEDRPGILVIDVRAGAPRDPAPTELAGPLRPEAPPRNPRRALMPLTSVPTQRNVEPALPRFSAAQTQWQFDALDRIAAERPTEGPAQPESLPFGLSVGPTPDEMSQQRREVAAPPPLPLPPDDAAIAALQEAEAALLRQVARAAAQGLVEPRQPRRDGTMEGAVEVGNDAEFDQHMAVNAKTGLDRELGLMADALRAGAGRRCLSEGDWAVADWGDFRPAAEQIAAARGRLVGEFDRPDPEAILALSRLYLHLGFGLEAKEVLRSFPVDLPQAPLLTTLAEVMDNGVAPNATDLHRLTECDTGAALWAVLARPHLTPADPMNRDRILRDFAILPPHLRQHLGPPLSERFREAGDEQGARTIRDAIRRIDLAPTPSVALMDARVDLAGGAVAEAEAQLQSVAAGTSPDAAEALAILIEERLARGQPVDAATAAHAEAMAFERGTSPIASRLARGNLRALASLGDFDAAMTAYNRLDSESQTQVLPDLLAELTRTAPDAAFLIHVFALRDRLEQPLPTALRLTMSDRLLDLGFPAEARLLLAAAATPGPEGALQRARAALLRQDPRAALREIAGRTDPEAEAVRAAAFLTLGQPSQAAEAYLAAGRETDAANAAWRAGDLTMAGRLSDPDRGAAIDALAVAAAEAEVESEGGGETGAVADSSVAPAPEPADASGGPLANARSLLARSAETRGAVDALLATFPAPQ